MKRVLGIVLFGLTVSLAPWTGFAQAEAERDSLDQVGLHGGKAVLVGQHSFETVFLPGGIRIYKYSADRAPMMMKDTKGTVTLRPENGEEREISLSLETPESSTGTVYFCPMHPEVVQMEAGVCEKCGGMKLFMQDYLHAKLDLSGTEPGTLEAVVHLRGLKGSETEATFTESYEGLTVLPDAATDDSDKDHHGHGDGMKGDQ